MGKADAARAMGPHSLIIRASVSERLCHPLQKRGVRGRHGEYSGDATHGVFLYRRSRNLPSTEA